MTRLISLLDIYATGGTHQFSDFYSDDFPTYVHMLTKPLSMSRRLPDVTARSFGSRTVTIELNNVYEGLGYGDEGYGEGGYGGATPPTISSLQQEEPLIGIRTRTRVYDLDAAATLFTVEGRITGVRMKLQTASLSIESIDTDVMEELIPKQLLIDVYATAELTGVSPDAPVIVPWGVMRKVNLALVASVADTSYDFGAFRKPASGSLTLNTVYRDGRVVTASEYTLTETPSDYYVVRFTRAQVENNSPVLIQADVTVSEFTSPDAAIKFVLNDATYGLGKSVNAASFATAATNYGTVSMTILDGMRRRRKAGEVLKDLLLHGAILDKNNAGEYTVTVDLAALHASNAQQVGVGDGNVENLLPDSIIEETPRLGDQLKTLILRGLYDPGFGKDGDGEQYLVTGTRTDADVEGREVELFNRFLSAASVPRELHYLWFRYRATKEVLMCDSGMEGKNLDVNDLVTVQIPGIFRTNEERNLRALSWSGTRRGADTEGKFTLELEKYDADIFTYVAEDNPIVTAPDAAVLVDYLFTPPTTPSSFAAPSDAVSGSNDGTSSVKVVLTANAPANDNISHLVFKAFRDGSAVVFDEMAIAASNGDTGVSAELDLVPGLLFDLQCVTRNIHNAPGFTDSTAAPIANHPAPGDTTRPGTVTIGAATVGTGKTIKITWTNITGDDTIAGYIITGPGTSGTSEVGRSMGGDHGGTIALGEFIYQDTIYDTERFFRVRAFDYTGNVSASYSGEVSATPRQTDTADIADGAVENLQVHNDLSAAKIATGQLNISSTSTTFSATGSGDAISIHYGNFAKVKWFSSAFTTLKAEIGAGSAGGFSGLQFIVTDSADDIRLGTFTEPFDDFGLYFEGDILATEDIFDSTSAPTSSSTVTVTTPGPGTTTLALPNRRLKLLSVEGDTYYIWCSLTA